MFSLPLSNLFPRRISPTESDFIALTNFFFRSASLRPSVLLRKYLITRLRQARALLLSASMALRFPS